MDYAIVDIETTGGHSAGGNITEIAIRIFDGNTITDTYETLVRPRHNIPPYITALTGIDNEMVCDSPTFEEIASEVFEMLNERVFVAHNVYFDYTFIKHHLEAAGYSFTTQKLCTVKIARKVKPGLPSYSLGKLCDVLGIEIAHRHRAGGDVDATVTLFHKLLEWDTEGVINSMVMSGSKEQLLPLHLPKEDFEALPNNPGVYYFMDGEGKVIYVGKAKDIKKRVLQHFTGNRSNLQRPGFLSDIHAISFELCGTELMAFILEAIEIKRILPKYNNALKKYEAKFGLFKFEDLHGYTRLFIGKYNKSNMPLQVFTTKEGGMNKLRDLTRRFRLCASLCRLKTCELCSLVDKRNDLLCTANESVEIYNERVEQALSGLKVDLPGFYIIDKGRNSQEKSCIWVENGAFYGMGYIDYDAEINSMEDIKNCIIRYPNSHYIMQLLISFMCKYPNKIYKLNAPID